MDNDIKKSINDMLSTHIKRLVRFAIVFIVLIGIDLLQGLVSNYITNEDTKQFFKDRIGEIKEDLVKTTNKIGLQRDNVKIENVLGDSQCFSTSIKKILDRNNENKIFLDETFIVWALSVDGGQKAYKEIYKKAPTKQQIKGLAFNWEIARYFCQMYLGGKKLVVFSENITFEDLKQQCDKGEWSIISIYPKKIGVGGHIIIVTGYNEIGLKIFDVFGDFKSNYKDYKKQEYILEYGMIKWIKSIHKDNKRFRGIIIK